MARATVVARAPGAAMRNVDVSSRAWNLALSPNRRIHQLSPRISSFQVRRSGNTVMLRFAFRLTATDEADAQA
jgi:hypothetical protein